MFSIPYILLCITNILQGLISNLLDALYQLRNWNNMDISPVEANQMHGKSVYMHLCKLAAYHSFHNMNIYYLYDQLEVC